MENNLPPAVATPISPKSHNKTIVLSAITIIAILVAYTSVILDLGKSQEHAKLEKEIVTLKEKIKQQDVLLQTKKTAEIINPTTQPSPTTKIIDTSSWLIFSDNLISFNYPKEWIKSGSTLKVPLPPECLPPHACGGNASVVTIKEHKNPKHLVLRDFIYENMLKEGADKALAFDETSQFTGNVNSGGFDSSSMNRNLPSGGSLTEVYYIKGDDVVELSFESIDPEVIDAILKTVSAKLPVPVL
jgi:hypothetical protein